VAVLVAAQALLGSQLPMLFVVGGLAGGMLADNLCFATLPISLIVFGSMTTAPWMSSFPLLLVGSYFTGIYMSANGFYRFAASDCASESFRPKAISYVMAGGLLSAIFGPQVNKLVFDLPYLPVFGGFQECGYRRRR